jgi:hypothetical protein
VSQNGFTFNQILRFGVELSKTLSEFPCFFTLHFTGLSSRHQMSSTITARGGNPNIQMNLYCR